MRENRQKTNLYPYPFDRISPRAVCQAMEAAQTVGPEAPLLAQASEGRGAAHGGEGRENEQQGMTRESEEPQNARLLGKYQDIEGISKNTECFRILDSDGSDLPSLGGTPIKEKLVEVECEAERADNKTEGAHGEHRPSAEYEEWEEEDRI